MTTSPNNDRLVITWQKDTSATEALSFTSVKQVTANYGFRSAEAGIARSFFAQFPTNTLTFIRYGNGQRPHLIGGNIDNLTLADLQAINGDLSVQLSITGGPTFTYDGTVSLSTAQSFADAAQLIVAALDTQLPVAAKTTGDTITAENLTFKGYVQPGQTSHLFVTALDANNDPIVPGGLVTGKGIPPGAQIIGQLNSTEPNGALGGTGEYDLFGFKGGTTGGTTGGAASKASVLTNTGRLSLTASTTMSESYGLLDVGSVTSGQLSVGERIQPTTTNGVPPLTAIAARASDGQNWIVNNAVTLTGDLTMTAPGLTVQQHAIVGTKAGTITNEFFDIQPDGHYGYNFFNSTMTAASGSAADALGLSTTGGAILSSPGGQHLTISAYMNHIINFYHDQYGNPISFGSFQSEEPRLDPLFEAWTQTPAGMGYTYIPHVTPPLNAGTLTVGHGPGPG